MTTIHDLIKLAEEAPSEPWELLGGGKDSARITTEDGIYRICTGGEKPFEMGQYIAACSPEVITDLCNRVLKLEEALKNIEEEAFPEDTSTFTMMQSWVTKALHSYGSARELGE